MELTHRFTVPADIETTWTAFNDIESVAGCFPGATVTSVEGDSFEGSCKVKLGPIALVYNGSGTFTEKDTSAHRMKIDAKGKDKRGNGTAGAKVTATLTGNGESTDVEVVTDLAITGKPAQFGRGVMQDVSDKLLGQFVDCLEQKVGGTAPEPPAAAAPAAPSPAAAAPAAPSPAAPASSAQAPKPPPAPSAPRPAPAKENQDDSLDLGATVLPVLAKTYWKQALGAAVGIAVVVLVVRKVF